MKTGLFGALTLVAYSACAVEPNWIQAAASDKSKVFIDVANIRELAPHKLQFWALFDYDSSQLLKKPPYESFKSWKVLYHVLCGVDQYALVASAYFSGNQGDGDVVDSFDNGNGPETFTHVVPGSIADGLVSFACNLKSSLLKK